VKFRFIGSDDPTENTVCTVFGLTFQKGEAVEVKDKKIADKLAGNGTFEAVGGRSAKSAEEGGELSDLTVPELKALAEDRGVDLGDATKKADIIAALELAVEAAE
jgi:hypothetical protein